MTIMRRFLALAPIVATILAATATATAPAVAAGAERGELLRQAAESREAAGLYRRACAACHGEVGGQEARDPVPGMTDLGSEEAVRALSPARILRSVREDHGDLLQRVDGYGGEEGLVALVAYIRQAVLPPAPVADTGWGQDIYTRTCRVCHGDDGNGASWTRAALDPSPFDFTSEKAKPLTRRHMIQIVRHGSPNTAMVGFTTQLSSPEIAAVVDYIRAAFVRSGEEAESVVEGDGPDHAPTVERAQHAASEHGATDEIRHAGHGPDPGDRDMSAPFADGLIGDRARGAKLYDANCTACHGEAGDGEGPRAYFMTRKPENFTSEQARAELNRPHLFASISMGVVGTEMPAWSKVVDDQQIADVAEYVLTKFLQPEPGSMVAGAAEPADGQKKTHK